MVNGNFPEGWNWLELRDVCTKIQDGTHFSPKTQYLEPLPGRFLYITAKNVKDYGIDLSDVRYVDEQVHRSIYARCNPEKVVLFLTSFWCKSSTACTLTIDKQKASLVEGRC